MTPGFWLSRLAAADSLVLAPPDDGVIASLASRPVG